MASETVGHDFDADIVKAVLAQVQGDESKAREVFAGMRVDRAAEHTKILTNLDATFDGKVPKKLLQQALEKADYEGDQAIIFVLELMETEANLKDVRLFEESEQKNAEMVEKEKRAGRDSAGAYLASLFGQLAEHEIQHMLDQNEGDVDKTTDQLLELVRAKEESRQQQAKGPAKKPSKGEEALFRREMEKKIRNGAAPGVLQLEPKRKPSSPGPARVPVETPVSVDEGKIEGPGEHSSEEGVSKVEGVIYDLALQGAEKDSEGFLFTHVHDVKVQWSVKAVKQRKGSETVVASADSHDWVGLFKNQSSYLVSGGGKQTGATDLGDAATDSRLTWQWVGQASEGELAFTVDAYAYYGWHTFRYFTWNAERKYVCTASTGPIWLGPRFDIQANTDPSGRGVTVSFVQKSGKPYPWMDKGWVGMFRQGEANGGLLNGQYVAYKWTADATVKDQRQTLQFELPKAGSWEFRLFPLRSYVDAARCCITRSGSDAVAMEVNLKDTTKTSVDFNLATVDPDSDRVWVGVYKKDETDMRQYRRYKYITSTDAVEEDKDGQVEDGAMSGKRFRVTFKTPIHAGVYEARLFSSAGGYDVLTRSNRIRVQGI